MKFDVFAFLENLSRKLEFRYNLTRLTTTLHEAQYTMLIIYRPVLLRKRNISDKAHRQNQDTHFVLSNFFFVEGLAVYEIMWKNAVELERPQTTIWRMRTEC